MYTYLALIAVTVDMLSSISYRSAIDALFFDPAFTITLKFFMII
jgi:hypothetical protein